MCTVLGRMLLEIILNIDTRAQDWRNCQPSRLKTRNDEKSVQDTPFRLRIVYSIKSITFSCIYIKTLEKSQFEVKLWPPKF